MSAVLATGDTGLGGCRVEIICALLADNPKTARSSCHIYTLPSAPCAWLHPYNKSLGVPLPHSRALSVSGRALWVFSRFSFYNPSSSPNADAYFQPISLKIFCASGTFLATVLRSTASGRNRPSAATEGLRATPGTAGYSSLPAEKYCCA